MNQWLSKRWALSWAYALCLLGIVIGLLFTIRLLTKPVFRGHYHGSLSDEAVAFCAGWNFDHCGFSRLYLMPTLAVAADCRFSVSDFYTHFPPGPHLASGLLHSLGIHGFILQKVCVFGVSLLALVFWVLFVQRVASDLRLTESQPIRWVSCAFFVSSPWFLYWSGNLYEWTYLDAAMAVALWALV